MNPLSIMLGLCLATNALAHDGHHHHDHDSDGGPFYVQPLYPELELTNTPDLNDVGATTFFGGTMLNALMPSNGVILPSCESGENNYVRWFRFTVENASANIQGINITFDDGGTDFLKPLRHNFDPGRKSRWMDLRGDHRCITQIEVLGSTDLDDQAEIFFFGK